MARHAEPVELGFRRRCGWCGIVLRAWQLNLCRTCRPYVVLDMPSPPVGHLSRLDAEPDRWSKNGS